MKWRKSILVHYLKPSWEVVLGWCGWVVLGWGGGVGVGVVKVFTYLCILVGWDECRVGND